MSMVFTPRLLAVVILNSSQSFIRLIWKTSPLAGSLELGWEEWNRRCGFMLVHFVYCTVHCAYVYTLEVAMLSNAPYFLFYSI
jgi:hypothetical protein